jgi:putative oxidoreductase
VEATVDRLRNLALLIGRVLIAALFIYDATVIARFPDATLQYMERFGVPGILLWPAAAFQFVGGLLIIAGLATRVVALGIAGFCAMTALLFHHDFANGGEVLHFGKDFALAGGFLVLAASGAGALSLDRLWRTDCWPLR